jgi:hypothetical protein
MIPPAALSADSVYATGLVVEAGDEIGSYFGGATRICAYR